jgi:S-adenosylmethionine hydrolase
MYLVQSNEECFMPIISLLTDFGIRDGFVGVMKGVILGICPNATIVDMTHTIDPQNVMQGAIALWRHAPFFPPGSVHVAVVDPGVGTKRRAIAARLGTQLYVAPDNGLLTPLILDAMDSSQKMVFIDLDKPEFWLQNVSQTFHGRDIFSPVGAHLAAGVPLEQLGSPMNDPILFEWSQPVKVPNGWKAHVTVIDVFGNITTDLRADQIADMQDIKIRILGTEIDGLVPSYGHRKIGDLISLIDSEGYLEVAEVNGNAAKRLNAQIGDIVEVISES